MFVVINVQLLPLLSGFFSSSGALVELDATMRGASLAGGGGGGGGGGRTNNYASALPAATVPPTTENEAVVSEGRTKTMNMKIVILTMDRFHSLERLMQSLKASDYLGDQIDLFIRFDLPKSPTDGWRTRVKDFQSKLKWEAGNVTYSIARANMGLRQAWLSAWRPSSMDDRAIIFEDGIEVSPLWYKWLKGAFEHYDGRNDIAGISLQRQTLVPGKTIDDNGGKPFLYKSGGSIGYAPMASKWLDFLDFAECALETDASVATPELITSDWYNSLDKRSMWTQLFIFFCKYYNLYTLYAFPSQTLALAAHWREEGEHFGSTGGRDFQLVGASSPWQMEYPPDLPKLDWDARPNKEPKLRSLVLSAAVGYQKAEYERFVSSLRMHYDGDVAFLVQQDAPQDIFDLLTEHNIQVVTTPEAGGARASPAWFSINHERWQFFLDACQEAKYDLCMGVDFRDTRFQDDPFRNMKAGRSGEAILHVYEHSLVMNAYHLNLALNCEQRNEQLKGKQIINSGGFFASPKAFPQLARWITQEAKACSDQVALNLVVHGNVLNSTVTVHVQGEGSINNVAWGAKFRKDSRQRFLNHNCFPAPAVHQFDLIE